MKILKDAIKEVELAESIISNLNKILHDKTRSTISSNSGYTKATLTPEQEVRLEELVTTFRDENLVAIEPLKTKLNTLQQLLN